MGDCPHHPSFFYTTAYGNPPVNPPQSFHLVVLVCVYYHKLLLNFKWSSNIRNGIEMLKL